MTTMTANQYELGPEQLIEAKLAAKFSELSPSRRPMKPGLLAYWLGQIVGWPGHEFFSATRRLVDQQSYAAALICEIAQSAKKLMEVTGQDDVAGSLWHLLCDQVDEDEDARSEAFLKRLGTLLPVVAEPPCFHMAGQPRKTGRPELDLFALTPISVVCAYLIHAESYAPPLRKPKDNSTDGLNITEDDVPGPLGPRPAFPRQRASDIAAVVLDVLGITIRARLDSLIKHALVEPWMDFKGEFDFWVLLPNVKTLTAESRTASTLR